MLNFVRKKLLVLFICLVASNSFAAEFYEISLAKLPFMKSEKISGIDIKLKSARIYSMSQFPMGWNVVVNNDPSWMTSFKGSLLVGAAALDQQDMKMLDHLVVIEKLSDKIITNDIPFSVELDIYLIDFIKNEERVIHADNAMFKLRKIKGIKR